MPTTDLKYLIALDMIPKVGSITAKKLVAYCGSAEAVFREAKSSLQKIRGINDVIAQAIVTQQVLQQAEKELEYIQKNNIAALIYTDESYPIRLKNCDDSPTVLFIKGSINLNHAKVVSIVGTRNATPYGLECCERLVEQLGMRGHNPIVVSGLAYGIDVCAHKSALKYGLKTVGVLGTGLNIIYPSQHRSIANQMLEQGALVSDFTSQALLDRNNFLKRNRIIAGLSDATIVVESGEKGGALITADIAMSYNRDVLAFPGRVGDTGSKGCNNLIKKNKAALIESVEDLEYALGWDAAKKEDAKQLPLFTNLGEKESLVVSILEKKEVETIDSLCRQTEIPISELAALLLGMEFSGYIRSLPGKAYSLLKR
ncbi:MAG: DNA-processing protein DprA [Prevotellaceae bacterium]|jgi:DNA processing protein|nr:DNA-processing protein DprA [Prevotellaceae bacterium]